MIIGNGPLVTRDKLNTFYKNGAVVIDKTKIIAVGPYEKIIKEYKDIKFIDANGGLIMPGLINAHEHIYSAFARGLNLGGEPPKDFLSTLNSLWWKIDRGLSLDSVYYSAMATYLECIRYGVTTVVDHHASYGAVKGSLFEIAKAAKELSVRTCLAYEISDRDGAELRNQAIKENMEFIDYADSLESDMLKGLVGLHASFTLSENSLNIIKRENTTNAGYHVHIAEGLYDEEFTKQTYHKSVVRRFYDEGILNDRSIAGHCIHISKEDMELIKQSGVFVVHNPESNMNNGVGSPDVIGMLDQGILVGLGTDGYTNDMFESVKVANILQKHRRGLPDRGFMEACDLLFENNKLMASNLFGETIGELSPGAKADVVIMDYDPYTPMDGMNINGHMMFGLNGAMTDTTVIDGNVVMLHKKILAVDEVKVLEECRKSAAHLWKSL